MWSVFAIIYLTDSIMAFGISAMAPVLLVGCCDTVVIGNLRLLNINQHKKWRSDGYRHMVEVGCTLSQR